MVAERSLSYFSPDVPKTTGISALPLFVPPYEMQGDEQDPKAAFGVVPSPDLAVPCVPLSVRPPSYTAFRDTGRGAPIVGNLFVKSVP